ncbi:myosin-G heavy chain [Drosophila sulfurigaster albostrigata]|uniref:myosin-G heavy chain n=1 Tax=Drosophila sulfurigaster albostrigata TaxID=89887 RepID=UPI002D21BB27|nr:myosin-G heavy chain [Drosophila sulfurigaster albostrigata]
MKRNKDEETKDEQQPLASSNVTVNKLNNNNSNASTNSNNNTIGNNSNPNDANAASAAAGTVRTTGRVKKPKLVYDPSDNYISRVARTSLPAATASPAGGAAAAAATVAATATTPTSAATQQPTSPAQQQSQPQTQVQTPPNAAANTTPANNSGNIDESLEAANSTPSGEQLRNFDTCSKCSKSEPKRGSGYKSNFLACKTCALKWHFNCLPIAFEILTNARKRFKCDKCRRCQVCSNVKLQNPQQQQMLMCCVCANAYHLDCHWPSLAASKISDVSWKCNSCDPTYNVQDNEDVATGQRTASSLSPPLPPQLPRKSKAGRKKRATPDPGPPNAKKIALAKTQPEEQELEQQQNGSQLEQQSELTLDEEMEHQQNDAMQVVGTLKSPAPTSPQALVATESASPSTAVAATVAAIDLSDETVPTERQNGEAVTDLTEDEPQQPIVQSWNVDQVVSYVEKFYPQESNIFKSQEIDGAALMVLTRQDIIDRFGLKLGPSLRIYQLVLSLQTSLDDVTLGWVE